LTPEATAESDRAALLTSYHQRLVERHGAAGVRSLGWTSQETQERRFLSLWRMAGSPGTGSLLDVGCGSGDLKGFLESHGGALQYIGIDARPEVVQIARQRHPDVRFEVRDAHSCTALGERFDCVFASGLFGLAAVCSTEYVSDVLASLWQVAGRVLVFNMNSDRLPAEQRKPEDFHGDPGAVLDFCLRQFSPQVRLEHGMARQSDCSVAVWREPPSNP
jgi:SAM-dependent methyltransferase